MGECWERGRASKIRNYVFLGIRACCQEGSGGGEGEDSLGSRPSFSV